ncbi:uncharacterized protein [Physcomitrium patens]|uniref:Uncharacterized protein n=1 Tax=Physcomitrium patens TaxID=3218 RepID=A0A2K1L0X2_PHYPA|nr:uncharacterized protein LOC112278887 isoform X2 [Physcomitrium patens]PNR59676.1 hypothetical protein PHYPA_002468 [Physcomitrium patens]|eukprot:XP_024368525.1 uncharacterized protein LOC112278887 isoform X2 [Physcomitrella patens]
MAMAIRSLHRLLATSRFSLSSISSSVSTSSVTQNWYQDATAICLGREPTRSSSSSSFVEPPEPCGVTPSAGHQPFLKEFPALRRVSSASIFDGGSASIHSGHHNKLLNWNTKGVGLQTLTGVDVHEKSTQWTKCNFSTEVSSSPRKQETAVAEGKEEAVQKTSLEDFQHEEIVGPTVERDLSPVADELRESLAFLQKRMLSFQKSLVLLGCVQCVGAGLCFATWQSVNPTWQLLPVTLLPFMLAFVLRQGLQPIAFFGKLEERSRLRIITLSLMIAKGFASYFNRARILVVGSAAGLGCIMLSNSLEAFK